MNRPPSPGTERLPPKKREPRQMTVVSSPPENCFKVPAPYSAPFRGKSTRQPSSYTEHQPLAPPLTPPKFSLPWYTSYPSIAPNPFAFDQDGLSTWRELCSGTSHATQSRHSHPRWVHAPTAYPLTSSTSQGLDYTASDPFAQSDSQVDPSGRASAHFGILPVNTRKYGRPNGFTWREARKEDNHPCDAGQLTSLASSEGRRLITQGGPTEDCLTTGRLDSNSLKQGKDPQAQFSTAFHGREPIKAEDNRFNSHRQACGPHSLNHKSADAQQSHPFRAPHGHLGLSTATYSQDLQADCLLLVRSEDGPETKQCYNSRDPIRKLQLSNASAPFTGGSLVELSGGRLKRVEELQTEDFVLSESMRPGIRLTSCKVLCIAASSNPGYAKLQVLLADRLTQELLEVSVEYPFFVCDQGWSSCDPQKTALLYALRCREIAVGDVCLALTPAPTQTVLPLGSPAEPTESPLSSLKLSGQPRKRHQSAPGLLGADGSLKDSPQKSKQKKEK